MNKLPSTLTKNQAIAYAVVAFNNFINSWKNIRKEANKYKCRPEMKEKDLSANDELIYFLNDDGELGNGMYLAAACQNFISWQNTFLFL